MMKKKKKNDIRIILIFKLLKTYVKSNRDLQTNRYRIIVTIEYWSRYSKAQIASLLLR